MCTNIMLKSIENDIFWGRTMDFTFDPFSVNSKITIIPENYEIKGESLTWVSKYRFMGINMNDSYLFFDGVNEAGLVGDLQYLEECSWDTSENLNKRGLTPLYGEEVVTWILSNYATVAEIAEAMTNFGLMIGSYQPFIDIAPKGASPIVPLHYTFTDKSGESIVLEPTDNGGFVIFKNTIGIMTNSPTYDWHLTNLRNYIELTDSNRGKVTLTNDILLNQIESGSGLLGLPGDYTAPSRFIRATFLSKFIYPFKSEAGINTLYKIFNPFIIAKGVEKVSPGSKISDFTGYWIGYDIKNLTLSIQPHDTTTFTMASLKKETTNVIHSYEVNHQLLAHQAN
ncbi:linear amide C-N hydrolase [Carnobacterium gallinarum]|uniref:linear amide C-N hydrolase n=1 Tax=Carnobacterium gallinarum TaxID=2749 RepID=UPI00055750B2|nr:linear amide C-N hydrolase [Carnobacterium gallinarum]